MPRRLSSANSSAWAMTSVASFRHCVKCRRPPPLAWHLQQVVASNMRRSAASTPCLGINRWRSCGRCGNSLASSRRSSGCTRAMQARRHALTARLTSTSPVTTISVSRSHRWCLLARKRRSTSTARRPRRAAWWPASGRYTANWNRHSRSSTKSTTVLHSSAVMQPT